MGVFIVMNTKVDTLKNRTAPIEMVPDDFRALGHELVDLLADWLAKVPPSLFSNPVSG